MTERKAYKRVLFYIENNWAFGSIHNALAKRLYQHGIYANVLDWRVAYTRENFNYLMGTYDLFVSIPAAVTTMAEQFGVPYEKLAIISHGQQDLYKTRDDGKDYIYDAVNGFAVVDDTLSQLALELGIKRVPTRLHVGIDTMAYAPSISPQLKTVGVGGAMTSHTYQGVDLKRGHLVQEALEGTNVEFKVAKGHPSFAMPGFYRNVDAIVVASTEETVGLPFMEAAAAGKLVMGTSVGCFKDHASKGGGILLPTDADDLKDHLRSHVDHFQKHPDEYTERCRLIQEYSRNYDWDNFISEWVLYLLNPN